VKYKCKPVSILLWVVLLFAAHPLAALSQPCDAVPDHFIFTGNTGESYSIVLDSTGFACDLQECDEIGVFDGDLCVGASVYQGTWPLAIVAWADDSQTGEVDGYVCGNEMSFRIWHDQSQTEDPTAVTHYTAGDGTFCSGPFARLWLECEGCPTPDAPANLGCSAAGGSIDLSWDAVASADEYCVYRNSVLLECGVTSTSYTDASPGAGEQCYMVTASNTCGESGFSNESCCTADQGCDDIPDHFIFTSNTDDSYSIVLDSTGVDCDLQDCDEVGVFDGDLCVGAAVFRGTWPLAIVAWADNSQTGEVDGYVCGHQMSFRTWDSELDFEISDELYEYYSSGDGTFCSGPFADLRIHCHWLCGDCNHSGFVDIDDVFVIVNYVFLGGPPPVPLESADVNCMAGVDIDDIYRLAAYIFLGEHAPCDPNDDGIQDCYLYTP
jgi:hypothetical protein